MLIILGSINADLVFSAPAIPRPGETVLCDGYAWAAGGKGANQAVAAARAGATVRFFGRVGDDEHGLRLRDLLAREGIDTAGLGRSERPTGTAIITVDPAGENSILVASGANLDVQAAEVPDELLRPGVTVLCENEIPPAQTLAFLARAKERGARTILNVAPAGGLALHQLGCVDVLVANETEAFMLTGDDAPERAVQALAQGREAAVVTLGGEGALGCSGSELAPMPAIAVRVVDTTGAGDAFVGVLATALDEGLALRAGLAWAITASGLACERLGAQTALPGRAAIEAKLASQP